MSRCVDYHKEFHLFERRIEEMEYRKKMVEDSLFNQHREYEMICNELCELKKSYRHMMCDTECYLGSDCKEPENEPKKKCCGEHKEVKISPNVEPVLPLQTGATITGIDIMGSMIKGNAITNNELNQIKDLAGRHYQPLRTE